MSESVRESVRESNSESVSQSVSQGVSQSVIVTSQPMPFMLEVAEHIHMLSTLIRSITLLDTHLGQKGGGGQ